MTVRELAEALMEIEPDLEVFCYNGVSEEYQNIGRIEQSNEPKYTKDSLTPPANHVVLLGGKKNLTVLPRG